jgi:phage shock protein PspC (stress-responsive transcriptional regulator)
VSDRLYRSRRDRLLGGVCGGLAERLEIDPSLVRIGWVLLTVFTGGLFLLLYIVMLVIVPEAPEDWRPGAAPQGPGAVAGWSPPTPGAATGAAGIAPAAGAPAPWSSAGDATEPGAAAPFAELAPPPAEPRRNDRTLAILFGIVLVLVGAYFLFREYLPLIDLGTLWPYAAIGLGLVFIVRSFRRREDT